jgi:hypothetical protein
VGRFEGETATEIKKPSQVLRVVTRCLSLRYARNAFALNCRCVGFERPMSFPVSPLRARPSLTRGFEAIYGQGDEGVIPLQ